MGKLADDMPGLRPISLTRGGGVGPTVCVSISRCSLSIFTGSFLSIILVLIVQHYIIRSYGGLTLMRASIYNILPFVLHMPLLHDDVMLSPMYAAHVHSSLQCALEVNLV